MSEQAVELYLEELHSRYLAGDNFQLLAAIRFCASCERELPEWVVNAFRHATNKWYTLQSKTLDEALGVAWPSGNALEPARKKRRQQITVYNKVIELLDAGRDIDDKLLADVGARYRLSNAEVADYYYSVKRFFEPGSVPGAIDQLLSRFGVAEAKESEG